MHLAIRRAFVAYASGVVACLGVARAGEAPPWGAPHGAFLPQPFVTPSWARWSAIRLDGAHGCFVRLANNVSGAAIARPGGSFRISARLRLDKQCEEAGRLILKVGGGAHAYACGYDHPAQELIFGLQSTSSWVMRAPFTADGAWHDVEFRFDSGLGGYIFVDGASVPLTFTGGDVNATLASGATLAATIGAGEGGNPFEALGPLGAGSAWASWSGANPLRGEIAYLRIERSGDGTRDLEMYFNEGAGAPLDHAGGLAPSVAGPAAWTTVEQPSYIRRWPMQTQGDEFLFGSSLFTDENIDPNSATTTVPKIVDAPGGGKALRCRVFILAGRHSEWRMNIPFPTSLDTYIAFDIYLDSSTMVNGGFPYRNWLHWARFGEGVVNDPAMFLGHFDHNADGVPGVRVHVASGALANFPNQIPFNQWKRVLVRYRAGRDMQGRLALSNGNFEWAALTFSKDDLHQFRLRMRSDGTAGTVYFRNIALGTDAQEVMFGGASPPLTRICGVLIENAGCFLVETGEGVRYAVENIGAFDAGDLVWVAGVLDPQCAPLCAPSGGCIIANTIDQCVAAAGELRAGPAGCPLFRTSAGAEYMLERTDGFTPPDRVYVVGRPGTSADICPPQGGPALMENEIWSGVAVCGELALGADGCIEFENLDGARFLLQHTGGLAPGDRVFVTGRMTTGQFCGAAMRPAIDRNTIRRCVPDLNGDGVVNSADLASLLGVWGQGGTPEDLNGDGVVNAADLAVLLGAWG